MTPCFECASPVAHEHHVVPKALGGTRTVPLCERCHSLVHDRSMVGHKSLTLAGLARARRKGKRLGRPPVNGPSSAAVRALRDEGKSWAGVAAELGCTVGVARLRGSEVPR